MSISKDDRKVLLRLARASVTSAVGDGPAARAPKAKGALAERRGCFVTLTRRGQLRGCIGTFHPNKPLDEQIIDMAASAARDGRFVYDPITADEVDQLTVQVSVLSDLEPIDDPLDIELGVHGIYVVSGGSGGCFLPEVATEAGWSKEEFLSHCCGGKAGMSPDAWRDGSAKVYTFTSEKFSDPAGE